MGRVSCGRGSESRNWAQVTAVIRPAYARRRQCGALSAGANEVLFMPVDPVDLARSVWTVSEINRGGGRASKAAYALVSVSGGVGVSSLTVALGLALRRLTQKQVALVDLGLQAASLSAILDLESDPFDRRTCRPDHQRRFDSPGNRRPANIPPACTFCRAGADRGRRDGLAQAPSKRPSE